MKALMITLLLMMHGAVYAASPTEVVTADKGGRMLLPASALVERGGVPGVYVLEQGESRFRMVRTGKSQGKRVQIISGVFGGESVIVRDTDELFDGKAVASQLAESQH